MASATTLLWFRQDLRLEDNPALTQAVAAGRPVIPIFIWSPREEAGWAPGAASRWWLHQSLGRLARRLESFGSRLVLRQADSAAEELSRLIEENGAVAVYWNRCYEPAAVARDTAIKTDLLDRRIDARSFNASLLFSPHNVQTQAGTPFQVFTPFWKKCLTLPVRKPLPAPAEPLPAPGRFPASVDLNALGLLPSIPWAGGLEAAWEPGELGAQRRLKSFCRQALSRYRGDRDQPASAGTSQLSPHLHNGEIGPVQIWQAIREVDSGPDGQSFLREVGWREFAAHLLFHFPHTPDAPLRAEYASFPWRDDEDHLRAWQRGRTGYPIVDAGMRQLWRTGWMHNRVRMVAGSFLVKHLLLPWQKGAVWFWDTLADADLANNTLGWQWCAGCGADAAPYFRVFNPVLQGIKFDPDGEYVRQWVPELRKLPTAFIHRPWEAPASVHEAAGVRLGETYPHPLVAHASARKRALDAFASWRDHRNETAAVR